MSAWRLIHRTKIDAEKWNLTVRNSSVEHIYGYTFYLDEVAPFWNGIVYGKYELVLPIFTKTKFGFTYLCQANHVQRTSIFGATMEIPQKQELEDIIRNLSKWKDFTLEQLISVGVQPIEKPNYVLELNSEFETLQQQFNSNTIRNIKKAKSNNVRIERCEGAELDDAVEIFKRNKSYDLPQEWYGSLMFLASKDYTLLYAARHDGLTVGYALLLRSTSRITFLFSALEESGKKLGAMHLLISDLIKEFSNHNLKFDFEGSENEGVAKFYRGFGAQKEIYYHYQSDGFIKRLKELVKG